MVKRLLEKGAEIDVQTKDGWTALHWAVRDSLVDNLRLLRDSGADATLKNADGRTVDDELDGLDLGKLSEL